jgi:hypothetical protein
MEPQSAFLIQPETRSLAASFMIDYATLRARVRIALLDPSIQTREQATTRIFAEAEQLRNGCIAVSEHFVPLNEIQECIPQLSETELVRLPEEIGLAIGSAVHYIGAGRYSARHFGLRDARSGGLLAYASINSLDWKSLVRAIRSVADPEADLLSLSRVYVARSAPRNTISRMLSLVVKDYACAGTRAIITTAVDQNLGFSGTSYVACGWSKIFSVPHLGYLYVDGAFHTRRQLIRLYGTDEAAILEDLLGDRFSASGPLSMDTLIFATGTNSDLRRQLQRLKTQELHRTGQVSP